MGIVSADETATETVAKKQNVLFNATEHLRSSSVLSVALLPLCNALAR